MNALQRWVNDHHVAADTLAAAALVAASLAYFEAGIGRAGMDCGLKGSRQALYNVVASSAASLLGFVLAVIPIVTAFAQGPRFKRLVDDGSIREVFDVYYRAIKILALAALVALLALVADTDAHSRMWLFYLTFALSCAAVVFVRRCVVVLRIMTNLVWARTPRPAPQGGED